VSASQFDGIPVWFLFPGSPAERAGVREGDRLLIVNGVRMGDIGDYLTARARDLKGMSVTLQRGNTIQDLSFVFDQPIGSSAPPLGLA
jgi:C-terminal processing protease CtpA/Prc